MALIPLRPLMEASIKHGSIQGAFNINTVAQAKAAIGAHEMLRSAAILRGASLTNGFMGGGCNLMNATLKDKKKGVKNIVRAVKEYEEDSPIPIVLHLNHRRNFDSYAVVATGEYTTVVIDGSSPAFDENVELTREVARYAHARSVSVEGELGVSARVGGHVFSEGPAYINPLKVAEFSRRTSADALAVSYGTIRGVSKGKDVKLHKEIMVAIRECLSHEGIFGALVPHGSSIVPKYIVNEVNGLEGALTGAHEIAIHELQVAARRGINKINVDTDIRLAAARSMKGFSTGNPDKKNSNSVGGVYELLESKREQFDPRVFLTLIIGTVITGVIPDEDMTAITDYIERGAREAAGTLVVQFGSYSKAPLVEQVSLEEMTERYEKMQT